MSPTVVVDSFACLLVGGIDSRGGGFPVFVMYLAGWGLQR